MDKSSNFTKMEGQRTYCWLNYHVNPKTSFWSRMIMVILLLSSPPIYILIYHGQDWFKAIFGSGVFFTGCLGLLSFLLKNHWDGNRKRYNALCLLENELFLQISTLQDNIDKMGVVIQRDIPVLTTPTLVEPDLKLLRDLARIEIKNDAFSLLSRVADLKAAIDFHSKTSLELIDDLKNPGIKNIAMERLKEQKLCLEKFVSELRELDIRVKFFIINDRPFWSAPIPFFHPIEYKKFLAEEPQRILQYLEEKNKNRQGPSYI